MSEADDLARRFLAMWSEYLTALLTDLQAAEPLRRWLAFAAAAADAVRPPADAAAATGASAERELSMAELARRVEELAERVAALERGSSAALGARRRRRSARS